MPLSPEMSGTQRSSHPSTEAMAGLREAARVDNEEYNAFVTQVDGLVAGYARSLVAEAPAQIEGVAELQVRAIEALFNATGGDVSKVNENAIVAAFGAAALNQSK